MQYTWSARKDHYVGLFGYLLSRRDPVSSIIVWERGPHEKEGTHRQGRFLLLLLFATHRWPRLCPSFGSHIRQDWRKNSPARWDTKGVVAYSLFREVSMPTTPGALRCLREHIIQPFLRLASLGAPGALVVFCCFKRRPPNVSAFPHDEVTTGKAQAGSSISSSRYRSSSSSHLAVSATTPSNIPIEVLK